jgi:hypothetical protein
MPGAARAACARAAIGLLAALCLAAASGCSGGGASAKTGKPLSQQAQQGDVGGAGGGDAAGAGSGSGSGETGSGLGLGAAKAPGATGATEVPGATGTGIIAPGYADGAAGDSAATAPATVAHPLVGVDNSGDVIEINEKMFIAQTNDIYLNIKDYIGKTVRYQGFFAQYQDAETSETYSFVVRNGPGCCPGVDNTAGFEVAWGEQWPNLDDWVEVSGKLELYEDSGGEYIRVNLSSLEVLDTRGADYVAQ